MPRLRQLFLVREYITEQEIHELCKGRSENFVLNLRTKDKVKVNVSI